MRNKKQPTLSEKGTLLERMKGDLTTAMLEQCFGYAQANLRTPDGQLALVFIEQSLSRALELAKELHPQNFITERKER